MISCLCTEFCSGCPVSPIKFKVLMRVCKVWHDLAPVNFLILDLLVLPWNHHSSIHSDLKHSRGHSPALSILYLLPLSGIIGLSQILLCFLSLPDTSMVAKYESPGGGLSGCKSGSAITFYKNLVTQHLCLVFIIFKRVTVTVNASSAALRTGLNYVKI